MGNLWLIWKNPTTRRRYKVGVLSYVDGKYTFCYCNPELDDARKDGFASFPGFPEMDEKGKTSSTLFDSIAARLPNKKRPDYMDLLNSYDLSTDADDLEILRATRGRLNTDNFEFVPEFNKTKIEFDLAGTSHSDGLTKLQDKINENDDLFLLPEPENEFDENAVRVLYPGEDGEKIPIGYVPRYYARQIKEILASQDAYSAMVKRIRANSRFPDENILVSVKIIFA